MLQHRLEFIAFLGAWLPASRSRSIQHYLNFMALLFFLDGHCEIVLAIPTDFTILTVSQI